MIKFSLLMCIYEKDDPRHLARCLESIKSLTVAPSEIVIVKDGPLTPLLDETLNAQGFTAPVISGIASFVKGCEMNVVSLPQSMTLGPARAAGVLAARHEWIAVMDSDDILVADRFEKQLAMIADNPQLGLVGGQIKEFTQPHKGAQQGQDGENDCHLEIDAKANRSFSARIVPTSHEEIVKYAKWRNPFNHMTVMFRKDAALLAGNYRYFPWMEDYDLWARMIARGTKCANHPDILVEARVSRATFERRRGIEYIKSEWRLQKELKSLGIISIIGFVRNAALRIPARLMPGAVLGVVYKCFARREKQKMSNKQDF